MEAGIGSCVGAAGVVAAWGAGNDAAIVAAMEVAIVAVVFVLSSSIDWISKSRQILEIFLISLTEFGFMSYTLVM